MRSASLLRVASLALALAAPFGTVAFAGDHANNEWRAGEPDGRQVATIYERASPGVVAMEQRAYSNDLTRQGDQYAYTNWNQMNLDEKSDRG